MSVGDFLYKLETLGHSPQREADDRERRRRASLEEARERQARIDDELRQLRARYPLEFQGAIDAAGIRNSNLDQDANRQIRTKTAEANLLTGKVLPATTQSTIAIEDNTFKNKGNLLTTVGGLSRDIQKDGITLRSNAAKDFFPLVTDQITKIQAAPVDLARSAIASQEMMAREDRALVEKLWHLQNPKRGFGQQLLSAAPGLAAAALLAFS